MGRAEELRQVAAEMRSARIVSIVGVGGVGKTRLALQVGSELLPDYGDGVWLCELASVLEPEDLPDAVAAAVGYAPPQGVSVADGLPRYLERKELLLILDNCEHLVDAVAEFVAATTARAARVSVLVTSREALGVRGEHAAPLASLPLPAGVDATSVLASDAGALFVARAAEARGEFSVDADERPIGARPLRAPRRHSAGDRAGRGADEDDDAGRDPRPARQAVPAAHGRAADPPGTASDAARRDRLVLRPPFRRRAGAARPALGVRGWLRPRRRGRDRGRDRRRRVRRGRASRVVGGEVARGAQRTPRRDPLPTVGDDPPIRRGTTQRHRHSRSRTRRPQPLLPLGRDPSLRRSRHDRPASTRSHDSTPRPRTLRPRHVGCSPPTASPSFWRSSTTCRTSTGSCSRSPRPTSSARSRPKQSNGRTPSHISAFPKPATGRAAARTSTATWRPTGRSWTSRNPRRTATDQRSRSSCEQSRRSSTVTRPVRRAGASRRWNTRDSAAIRCCSRSCSRSSAGSSKSTTRSSGCGPPKQALAVARTTGSAVASLYPLLALTTSARYLDPKRALDAADEALRTDATQRQIVSNIVNGNVGDIRFANGQVTEGLAAFRGALRSYDDAGARTLFTICLGELAAALAPIDPLPAVDLAAVAESDAIAPFAAFGLPELARLAEERPTDVASARDRVCEAVARRRHRPRLHHDRPTHRRTQHLTTRDNTRSRS